MIPNTWAEKHGLDLARELGISIYRHNPDGPFLIDKNACRRAAIWEPFKLCNLARLLNVVDTSLSGEEAALRIAEDTGLEPEFVRTH